jgi:hypothetical protein
MRVLRHLSSLISVEEDIINVERSSNKGLLVSSGNSNGPRGGTNAIDSPEALSDWAEVEVNLDLVVLEGNQREGKSRVSAKPELQRNIQGGLRKSVSRSANLGRRTGSSTWSRNTSEGWVSNVGELSGVSNHLEISTLLLGGQGDLIPDVHPVSVLSINSLSSDFNLNLCDNLFSNEVHPSGINTSTGVLHGLVNLRESHLKVGSVSKISVSGDSAGDTSSEISLSGEGLFDGLHREIGVSSVRYLPEGNLRGTGKENVLCAVSYKLHKCSTHFFIIVYIKIIIWEKNIN